MKKIISLVAAVLLLAGCGSEKSVEVPVEKTPVKKVIDTTTQYSTDEVMKHATNEDCWTSINGGVYNLTNWIAQHPGGVGPIQSICGGDGSGMFNMQHGGMGTPQDTLKVFQIGVLESTSSTEVDPASDPVE